MVNIMKTTNKATATFEYQIGSKTDKITVGSKSSVPKTKDQWEKDLCLQAGRSIREEKKLGSRTFSIKLIELNLE